MAVEKSLCESAENDSSKKTVCLRVLSVLVYCSGSATEDVLGCPVPSSSLSGARRAPSMTALPLFSGPVPGSAVLPVAGVVWDGPESWCE